MIEIPERLLRGAHPAHVLLQAGVDRAELQGPLWSRTRTGHYAWAATDARHPRQRALAAASNLPDDGAVGGCAAAFLHGARQLDGSTPDPDVDQPVLQCLQRHSQRRADATVVTFRSTLLPEDVVEVDGVAVTSRVRTAFDLARLAPSVTEAVVALDVVARDLGVPAGDVLGYADERRRWRGIGQVRAACPLVDPRTASPQESRFRMLWVRTARLPRPLCNWPVLDLDGNLLGIVDLLDADAALSGEYDGADHAAPERRALDHARQHVLQEHRLRVVRAAAPDLGRYRARTVQRLTTAYERGRRRDRSRDRWLLGEG